MNRLLVGLFNIVILFCYSSVVESKELIKQFKGSESRTTAEFEVKAPWVIDWMTNGDYPGVMAVDVHLVTSPGGQYVGKVMTTKWIDNGVRIFDEGGTYRLQVDSNLVNWTFKIEQLTRQEAETYLPKE